MKKKKAIPLLLSLALSLSVTGCNLPIANTGDNESSVSENDVAQYDFDITGETCNTGISENDKNFFEKLIDNTYYVVHDGVYYPIYYGYSSVTDEATDDEYPANYYDVRIYSSEWENNIPTLFEGDKLVYYSTSNLLNYTSYYRMQDCGYTVGVMNLTQNIGGRYILNIADSNNVTILNGAGLDDIYNQDASDYVLFDKISGVQITDEFIDGGTIAGLEKDAFYDFELYIGTYFKPVTLQSKFHIFRGFEKFASVKYTTLQDFLYEVNVPEYLATGYYYLNGMGMLRIVRGNSYNSDTDFNKPLLILPEFDENGQPVNQDKYLYSEEMALNRFTTSVPESLGYVDPDAQAAIDEILEETEEEKEQTKLSKTVTKEFDLWLLPGKTCSIKISSPTLEKTGKISITAGDVTKEATYDRINNTYNLEINGRGDRAKLSISGFKEDYKIKLTDCQQYNGQDIAVSDDTENNEEPKKSFANQIKEVLDSVLHTNG